MPPTKIASFIYEVGEVVLAYHGPLLHEAQILEREVKDSPDGKIKIRLYLLHYHSSNSFWDEWVPESRVLKSTDENKLLQKERVKEFQRTHKRKLKEANCGGGSGTGGIGGNKKAKGTSDSSGTTSEESLHNELKEALRLPHGMKLKLIEDWERITRERKLVPLPRTPSVTQLLDDFNQTKARRTSHERLYGEVCDGLKQYFNQALPTILLYKFERRQYLDSKDINKAPPVDVYGAEHLLRLFTKMPELLARCSLQREHMTVLNAKLNELVRFLQSNKAKYFSPDYVKPNDDYFASWNEKHNEFVKS